MSGLIDRDRLILSMNDWMLQNVPAGAWVDATKADTILDAIKMVEDSPAVDAVEVVRCGQCAYHEEDGVCNNVGGYWEDFEFCSDGERREDVDT